jgi:hypothetical protein
MAENGAPNCGIGESNSAGLCRLPEEAWRGTLGNKRDPASSVSPSLVITSGDPQDRIGRNSRNATETVHRLQLAGANQLVNLVVATAQCLPGTAPGLHRFGGIVIVVKGAHRGVLLGWSAAGEFPLKQ